MSPLSKIMANTNKPSFVNMNERGTIFLVFWFYETIYPNLPYQSSVSRLLQLTINAQALFLPLVTR